jgi:nitroreductase
MNTQELIQSRRSVRKYTDEPVSEDQLQQVLDAVRWAPSWVNFQPWEVVVVDDPEVKQRLQQCVLAANPGRKAVVAAPYVLALCGRLGESGFHEGVATTEHGDWVMFDLGIAAQNLCLAAWDLGLGTLHLGLLDHAAAAEVLGVPEGVKVFELIPLGVPAKVGKAPPRKSTAEFTHRNGY